MARVVISDIHADDEALRAALRRIYAIDEFLQRQGSRISSVYVAGDILGRNARPCETLDLLIAAHEQYHFFYMPGNHEENMHQLDYVTSVADEIKYSLFKASMKGIKTTDINSWFTHHEMIQQRPEHKALYERIVSGSDCNIFDNDGLPKGICYQTDKRLVMIVHANAEHSSNYLVDEHQREIVFPDNAILAEKHLDSVNSLVETCVKTLQNQTPGLPYPDEAALYCGHVHVPAYYRSGHVTIINSGSITSGRGSKIPGTEDLTGRGTFLLVCDEPNDPTIDGQRELLCVFDYPFEQTIAHIETYNAKNPTRKLYVPERQVA